MPLLEVPAIGNAERVHEFDQTTGHFAMFDDSLVSLRKLCQRLAPANLRTCLSLDMCSGHVLLVLDMCSGRVARPGPDMHSGHVAGPALPVDLVTDQVSAPTRDLVTRRLTMPRRVELSFDVLGQTIALPVQRLQQPLHHERVEHRSRCRSGGDR